MIYIYESLGIISNFTRSGKLKRAIRNPKWMAGHQTRHKIIQQVQRRVETTSWRSPNLRQFQSYLDPPNTPNKNVNVPKALGKSSIFIGINGGSNVTTIPGEAQCAATCRDTGSDFQDRKTHLLSPAGHHPKMSSNVSGWKSSNYRKYLTGKNDLRSK